MKSIVRKSTAMALVAMLALTGCGEKQEEVVLDGTKAVMSVNGEDVTLGTAAFYTKFQQASMYQIYSMYFGMTDIFDEVYDEESGLSYGEEMKAEILQDLQSMIVVAQRAEEYGVSITDEQAEAIDAAAQAYIDGNSEEALAKVGASKEDVVRLMEIQTLNAYMRDPIVADVDTEVSDEEAQQTTLTYIEVAVPDELPEVESAAESAVTEVESVMEDAEDLTTDSVEAEAVNAADTESVGVVEVTESGAESVVESAVEDVESSLEDVESSVEDLYDEDLYDVDYEEPDPELQAYAEAKAQLVLDALLVEENIADADMDAIAQSIDEELYATTGQFTTNDPIETSLDYNLVEAAQELTDGELCDYVVKSEDGTAYYVFRLDKVFDEEATESQKDTIVEERREEAYSEIVDGWVEEAEITVDDDVWATLEVKDSDPVTLALPTAEEDEITESSAEAVAESAAESAVESVVESSAAAVTEVEPVLDETISQVTSLVESAVSGVESVMSEAESTVS